MDTGSAQASLDALRGIAFQVRHDGQITDIGAAHWDKFAIQNDAPELTANQVVGSNLFDFIAGDDVKERFRRVIRDALKNPDVPQFLQYRCDSPTRLRRILQMVQAVPATSHADSVLFQTIEIEAHERPPIDLLAHQQAGGADGDLPCVSICSWCQRVKYAPVSDDWMETEDFARMGGPAQARVTHCICEDCFAELEKGPHVPSP